MRKWYTVTWWSTVYTISSTTRICTSSIAMRWSQGEISSRDMSTCSYCSCTLSARISAKWHIWTICCRWVCTLISILHWSVLVCSLPLASRSTRLPFVRINTTWSWWSSCGKHTARPLSPKKGNKQPSWTRPSSYTVPSSRTIKLRPSYCSRLAYYTMKSVLTGATRWKPRIRTRELVYWSSEDLSRRNIRRWVSRLCSKSYPTMSWKFCIISQATFAKRSHCKSM